jgi:DNA-binding LacI/PurR family transcriptional regulator
LRKVGKSSLESATREVKVKKITTINDVAREAGVAASTVSRVLADSPRISSETKERINKIIQELDYHPNILARSLASKTTNIVAILIPELTEKAFRHPFFPEIIRGITAMAHKYCYNILLTSVSDVKEEKKYIKELINGGIVSGLILLASRTKDPCIAELRKSKFPFVVVGRPQIEDDVNWVDNNNMSIAYDLTMHLIEQGHKKIAFVGLTPEFVVTMDRYEGYKRALQESGIEIEPDLVLNGKYIDDAGFELAKQLPAPRLAYTAVIACDDLLAFGIMKYLNEKGLKIPDDVAIAGFNNFPLCEYVTPTLTSVKVNEFDLGSKAFQILYSNIEGNVKSFNRSIIPAELIIRKSTQKQ